VSYRLYGLVLASNLPLPELAAVAVPSGEDPDVRFRRAPLSCLYPDPPEWFMHWRMPSGEPWLSAAKNDDGYLLRFHDHADFVMDEGGREIVCRYWQDGAPETLRHLLIDQVMPLVLNLRGAEALHASAVLVDGGAVAFTGPTGTGKSTLAAELARAGHSVISDDCLGVVHGEAAFEVVPAYPGLRLRSDALHHLDLDERPVQPVAEYTDKCRLTVEGSFADPSRRCPLRAVFVLDDGPAADGEAVVRELHPRDATMELIRSAFRFEVQDRSMLERQLELFTRVAAAVPVRRVSAPRDLARLPDLRRTVLRSL
jgi:energy-coupling factor transporter ATP-binding protein EcfA2